jgi:hypothetical protein
MTFFNKKEDVIKLELTPHGRKLLSEGKMKPIYYAFLDDDVLYDGSNGNLTENSTDIKDRILSNTVYLKPPTNYKGVDSSKSDSDNKLEQMTFLQQKIGSSKTEELKSSGWNITALLGEITSSVNTLSGSNISEQPIPQLEFELNYTMSVGNANSLEISNQGLAFDRQFPVSIKQDGSFVDIKEEQILLNIFEKNGFYHKDSYEIEVYMFEQDEVEINKKLKFYEQEMIIKNNMLLEEDDQPSSTEEITSDFVEYYMNIQTDKEIPEEDICEGLNRLKKKDIFLDIEVQCPDRDNLEINIYGSRIKEEDLEDC